MMLVSGITIVVTAIAALVFILIRQILELRKKNAYGRWDGLSGMRLGLSFVMKLG